MISSDFATENDDNGRGLHPPVSVSGSIIPTTAMICPDARHAMTQPPSQVPDSPSGILICVNDVSVDNPDFGEMVACAGGELDADGMDQVKRQWRRSSWCPEEGRKKEEKHEKQKMILAVVGKSQSLSSLEGDDDDDDDDDDDIDGYGDVYSSGHHGRISSHCPASTAINSVCTTDQRSAVTAQQRSATKPHTGGRRLSEDIRPMTHVESRVMVKPGLMARLAKRKNSELASDGGDKNNHAPSTKDVIGRLIDSRGTVRNDRISTTSDFPRQSFQTDCNTTAYIYEYPASVGFGISLQQTLIDIQKFVAQRDCHQLSNPIAAAVNDAEIYIDKLNRNKARIFMADAVNNMSTGEEEEEEATKREAKQQKVTYP